MKNIVNYLDEFIDEENGIYECTKHNISDMKDRMKISWSSNILQ